jgi:hypothetical protein
MIAMIMSREAAPQTSLGRSPGTKSKSRLTLEAWVNMSVPSLHHSTAFPAQLSSFFVNVTSAFSTRETGQPALA